MPSFPANSAITLLLFFKAAMISPFLTNLFSMFNFPTISTVLIRYDLVFFAMAVPKVSILLKKLDLSTYLTITAGAGLRLNFF